MKLSELFEAKCQLPELETGDELLVGKFKNRKAIIKSFKTDDLNQPVAITDRDDQALLKPRVPKLYPKSVEESIERVELGNGMFAHEISVIKNPTGNQVLMLLRKIQKRRAKVGYLHIRGYIDSNNYYIWDASSAIHADAAIALGLKFNYENRCDIVTDYNVIRFDCEFFERFENLSIIKKLQAAFDAMVLDESVIKKIKESVERVMIYNRPLNVYKNLSFEQIGQLIQQMITSGLAVPRLTGYIDPKNNDYYVWDARLAMHDDVVNALGIEYDQKHRCDIAVNKNDDVEVLPAVSMLLNIPKIARLTDKLLQFKFKRYNINEEVISYYPKELKDEYEIMKYMLENSSEPRSPDEEYNVFDRPVYAVLELLHIDDLYFINNDENNFRSSRRGLVKAYSKMNPKTIPPIVVDGNSVLDGNHRAEAAKNMGLKEIWAYVIKDRVNNLNEDVKHEDGLTYELGVTDYHSGETYGYIRLFDEKTKKQIGYLNWSSYRDEVFVKMISVEPEYRRKGYATKIVKYLQEQFLDKKIVYSNTTDDGSKFLKSVGGQLEESSRLFSGVRLDEIPQQYKHLKVLGRGTTAIALEKDANTVLIFTRDTIKTEWLTQSWGLALAKYIDAYDSHKHHIRKVNELPIHILEMPKLYPLDATNRKIVSQLMKEFQNVKISAVNYSDMSRPHSCDAYIIKKYQGIFEKYEDEFKSDHQLKTLIEFIQNYSPSQYTLDLWPGNFKQTQDGKLIVLDPLADRELLNLWFDRGNDR